MYACFFFFSIKCSLLFKAQLYLCQGGYVFAKVCLFVSNITQKVIDGFWLNFQEISTVGPGTGDYSLGIFGSPSGGVSNWATLVEVYWLWLILKIHEGASVCFIVIYGTERVFEKDFFFSIFIPLLVKCTLYKYILHASIPSHQWIFRHVYINN